MSVFVKGFYFSTSLLYSAISSCKDVNLEVFIYRKYEGVSSGVIHKVHYVYYNTI